MRLFLSLIMILSLTLNSQARSKKKGAKFDPVGKKLFETNCLACHNPIQAIAGPTLHEINKLYEKNANGIVSWAKKPGRKRTEGIAMPAMAHIPEKDLKLIADYMLYAGSRVSRKELRKVNAFKEELGRIQRTFMPNSSVVSFAIKYSDDLSLCWDGEKGITRYIWQGKIDPKTHFTGNGKVIPAIEGKVIFRSSESMFVGLSPKVNYHGYKVSKEGLPIFYYKRAGVQFSETHSYKTGNISWKYKISGLNELKINLPRLNSYKTVSNKGSIKNGLLILDKQELKDFTITFTKEK